MGPIATGALDAATLVTQYSLMMECNYMLDNVGYNVNFLRSHTKIQTMTESHEEFLQEGRL